MSKFTDYLKGISSANELLSKGALIAPPAIATFSYIYPPWPENSGIIIGFFISIFQIAVAAYIFSLNQLNSERLDRSIKISLASSALLLVSYLIFFNMWVHDSKVGSIVIGFISRYKYLENMDIDHLLEAAGFNPFQIWEPWTVIIARMLILLNWIGLFVAFCAFFAFFQLKSGIDQSVGPVDQTPSSGQ